MWCRGGRIFSKSEWGKERVITAKNRHLFDSRKHEEVTRLTSAPFSYALLLPSVMKLTVKELIRLLELQHPDSEVSFDPLTYSRVKSRGERLVHIEFNEAHIGDDGKRLVFERSGGTHISC